MIWLINFTLEAVLDCHSLLHASGTLNSEWATISYIISATGQQAEAAPIWTQLPLENFCSR